MLLIKSQQVKFTASDADLKTSKDIHNIVIFFTLLLILHQHNLLHHKLITVCQQERAYL
jgi:hypothetical protein